MVSIETWKRTDYTDSQEAKLKLTVHADRRKETNTERERCGGS